MTVGQTTYTLPDPFFTIATQNPIEQEGTYPLPEAQLDRFMFNIKVDYPSADEEEKNPGRHHAEREGRGPQSPLRQGDPQRAEARRLGGGDALHRPVRLAAGPGHAAEGPHGPGIHPRPGRLGRRAPGRAIPDSRRQVLRGDGRPVLRFDRGRAESGHPGPPPPAQHQLSGPGRRSNQRGLDRPADPRDPAAGDSEVREIRHHYRLSLFSRRACPPFVGRHTPRRRIAEVIAKTTTCPSFTSKHPSSAT